MRSLFALSIGFFVLIAAGCVYVIGREFEDFPLAALFVFGGIALILGSGVLSSWLWFKRGEVYRERGQSGPDD